MSLRLAPGVASDRTTLLRVPLEEHLMMRAFVPALAVVLVCTCGVFADELKGKVKSVDAEKMQLVVTDDNGQDQTVTFGKEAQVVGPHGLTHQRGLKSPMLKPGAAVTITYENKEGQMTASKVHITAEAKGKEGGGE
jgi:hypothetical protein